MNEDRDRDLGAALRALPTPEHRPGFWEELALQDPPGGRRWGRRGRALHRRPFPGLAVVAVAAAVALVVASVVVLRPGEEREGTRVVTEPPTPSTTTPAPSYLPGPERALGDGLVAGVSADGSAALVVAEDTESDALGCEGMGATALFAAPLDGGARRRSVPGPERVEGTIVRSPADPTRVAVVSSCEEFLTDVFLAREGAGGVLSEVTAVDRDLLADLVARLAWTRDGTGLLGVVSGTWDVVRIDPAAGTRRTVLAGQDVMEVAEMADGTLVVLTRDGRLRLGDVVHAVPAVGMAVSPDGRRVAAYGDGAWLFAPGAEPRPLAARPVSHATWAPDGRALVLTGQGAYPDGGALSIVTFDGVTFDGGILVVATTGVVGPGHLTPDGRALAFTRLEPRPGGDGSEGVVERAVVMPLG